MKTTRSSSKTSAKASYTLPAEGALLILPLVLRGDEKRSSHKTQSKRQSTLQLDALTPISRSELNQLDTEFNGLVLKKLNARRFGLTRNARTTLELTKNVGKSGVALTVCRISVLGESRSDDLAQNAEEWRKMGGDALVTARATRSEHLVLALPQSEKADALRVLKAFVEGLELAQYEFQKFKGTTKRKDPAFEIKALEVRSSLSSAEVRDVAQEAALWAGAVHRARDLVNTPPSDLPPVRLVQEAKRVARGSRGRVSLSVLDKKKLTRLGAGALLGVSRGSDEPPFLIHLHFKPRKRSKRSKQIVLIGKGVTFDSGGLSIKTGTGMMEMKCDMAGAACCLAVIEALIELDRTAAFQNDLHVLIPTTENMINGLSVKPGDVLTALNRKTIEVLNTDAEGRLILADALAYSAKLKPDMIIDLATLTGACVVALGSDYAGLFANDTALRDSLLESAKISGEKFWELPLAKEYRPQIESGVADLKNISTAGGPGAIIGAIFLQEFVPAKTPWVHLDIAGPAFWSKSNEYTAAGGTGFGVRTLLEFLKAQ